MSNVDDPKPQDTIPEFPPEPELIAAGKAQLHVTGAFVDLLLAVDRAQGVCHAIARAFDAQSAPKP